MKRYVRAEDRKHKAGVVKVLSEETRLDQSHHDLRYWKAIQAGMAHHQAWLELKKRRRATLHRAQNARERAAVKLEEEWTRKFKTEQAREYMDGDTERIESQIETEVVEESKDSSDKLRVHRGAKETDERKATKRVRRALTKEELDQFREEPKWDELEVMAKLRNAPKKKKARKITKASRAKMRKKEKKKMVCRGLLWYGECKRTWCPFDHDPAKLEGVKIEVNKKFCWRFIKGKCKWGSRCWYQRNEDEKDAYEAETAMKEEEREREEEVKIEEEEEETKPEK